MEALVDDALDLHASLWGIDGRYNPAPTPVSLERHHLPVIRDGGYAVAEKSHGDRRVLLLGRSADSLEKEYAVLLGRRLRPTWLAPASGGLAVAHPSQIGDRRRKGLDLFDGTLLDGELIGGDGGAATFVAFDAVATCGWAVSEKPLLERIRCAAQVVEVLGKDLRTETGTRLAFAVKEWNPVGSVPLSAVLARSPFPQDGAVFVPLAAPVAHGRAEGVFKWKPLEQCTVDLLFRAGAFWTARGAAEVPLPEGVSARDPGRACEDGAVYELRCAAATRGSLRFVPVRRRPDKEVPNQKITVEGTARTIREDVTLEELDAFFPLV